MGPNQHEILNVIVRRIKQIKNYYEEIMNNIFVWKIDLVLDNLDYQIKNISIDIDNKNIKYYKRFSDKYSADLNFSIEIKDINIFLPYIQFNIFFEVGNDEDPLLLDFLIVNVKLCLTLLNGNIINIDLFPRLFNFNGFYCLEDEDLNILDKNTNAMNLRIVHSLLTGNNIYFDIKFKTKNFPKIKISNQDAQQENPAEIDEPYQNTERDDDNNTTKKNSVAYSLFLSTPTYNYIFQELKSYIHIDNNNIIPQEILKLKYNIDPFKWYLIWFDYFGNKLEHAIKIFDINFTITLGYISFDHWIFMMNNKKNDDDSKTKQDRQVNYKLIFNLIMSTWLIYNVFSLDFYYFNQNNEKESRKIELVSQPIKLDNIISYSPPNLMEDIKFLKEALVKVIKENEKTLTYCLIPIKYGMIKETQQNNDLLSKLSKNLAKLFEIYFRIENEEPINNLISALNMLKIILYFKWDTPKRKIELPIKTFAYFNFNKDINIKEDKTKENKTNNNIDLQKRNENEQKIRYYEEVTNFFNQLSLRHQDPSIQSMFIFTHNYNDLRSSKFMIDYDIFILGNHGEFEGNNFVILEEKRIERIKTLLTNKWLFFPIICYAGALYPNMNNSEQKIEIKKTPQTLPDIAYEAHLANFIGGINDVNIMVAYGNMIFLEEFLTQIYENIDDSLIFSLYLLLTTEFIDTEIEKEIIKFRSLNKNKIIENMKIKKKSLFVLYSNL